MKPPAGPSRVATILLGVARVARGRKEGLLQFGATPEAVLAALAPLVALLLVAAVVSLARGRRDAAETTAVLSILLLAPLVITFEIARHLGRAERWFRFATAFCWCQWAAPAIAVVVTVVMGLLTAGGMGENGVIGAGYGLFFGYALWLNWFIARHALDLTPFRAVLAVLGCNIAITLLLVLPQLADYAVNGPPS